MNDNVTAMSNWDLGDFLADRQMPTTTVTVYLNEVASHAKAQLLKAHATAKADEVESIDARLAEVEKALEESKYVIHLTAISSDLREDIRKKVTAEFPIKRNFLNQLSEDDPTLERAEAENLLMWEACIRKMETPKGQVFENPARGDIQALDKGLPTAAKIAIDGAIKSLHEEAERFTVEVKNADF